MSTMDEELAAYSSDLIGRIGIEAATQLFEGQIGEARLILGSALRTGQGAPEFALPDACGNVVPLSSLFDRGPVVLTFYRGSWCPYCNIALRVFQSRLGEIRQRGADLVAISPERPDLSLTLKEKAELGFTVLSDADNLVARRFGLVYRVSDAARSRLLTLGRDLVARNGNASWELPVTATYVIDQDGMITFAHVDADYRNRLDPAAVIDALSA